ncbi:MAG: hypothetical protein ACRDOJ_12985 [Nocardioidaceae bacterium]
MNKRDHEELGTMMNVEAVQAEIEYRHQRLIAEAEEYRRARHAGAARSRSGAAGRLSRRRARAEEKRVSAPEPRRSSAKAA